MKDRSITGRLLTTVLAVQLVTAVCMVGIAAGYERHVRVHAFDVALRGRADSMLGSVQDKGDEADNVMLDRSSVEVPAEDVYEVRDEAGHLLGRSENWAGPTAAEVAGGDRVFQSRIAGRRYRVVEVHGVRVVDPTEAGGGTAHRVQVMYGAPTAPMWKEVWEAATFYATANVLLLLATGMLLAWLLRRGLLPLRALAERAAMVSAESWAFEPPGIARRTKELAPLTAALEAALHRLEESFEQQRRFVGDAAHELKTAVAVVQTTLQLLQMRQRSAAEYEAGVARALGDSRRMEELVAKMLTLARAESAGAGAAGGGEAHADMAVAARETVERLSGMAEARGVRVMVEAEGESGVAMAVEEASLVCSNLLLNALQHSSGGGRVWVEVRREGGGVELRVRDEGDGIDAAALPFVFERFFRGDPSRSRNTGGSGLGLAICKAIVDRAGGRIGIESRVGEGTEVQVWVPGAEGDVRLGGSSSGYVNAAVGDS